MTAHIPFPFASKSNDEDVLINSPTTRQSLNVTSIKDRAVERIYSAMFL